eukprot:gnl/TRDRNA2_/TRDRNA2_192012_c0_seq1.p1 gnl/TRDRNA2_/TRDRNA2_192012_c0~~gnl/TRDRNA2_/TRDRNA2_192012_c0_seq1.p1  ORF type:complete len:294 (+),score=43.58 gnl/TRDRNA2_/TRDRNA2_192012_c0_seq1:78-959(+)
MYQQGSNVIFTLFLAAAASNLPQVHAIAECSSDEASFLAIRRAHQLPDAGKQEHGTLIQPTTSTGEVTDKLSEELAETNFSAYAQSVSQIAKAANLAQDAFAAKDEPPRLASQLFGRVLAGWGRRHKYVFFVPVHIYDVGLYLDTKSSLWGRSNIDVDEATQDFPGKASLLIDITTPLADNARITEELHSSIDPRRPWGADTGPLAQMDSLLYSGPRLGGGSRMLIDFVPGGVNVGVDGRRLGFIGGDWVTRAVIGMYFDSDPLIPNFAQRFREGLTRPGWSINWSLGPDEYE